VFTTARGVGVGFAPQTRRGASSVALDSSLRRNGCFPRTDVVDGRFSTSEQRAIRNCQILTRAADANDTKPHLERAVEGLEKQAGARAN